MEPIKQTSKQFFRTIQLIFIALFSGQLLFALVAIYMNSGQNMKLHFFSSEDPIFIAATALAIAILFVSRIMYKIQIKKCRQDDKLPVKIMTYQTAIIIKLALVEGASLFLITSFLFSANLTPLIFALLMMLQFYFFKPSKEEAIRDLKLDYTEIAQVNNPDAIIAEIKKV